MRARSAKAEVKSEAAPPRRPRPIRRAAAKPPRSPRVAPARRATRAREGDSEPRGRRRHAEDPPRARALPRAQEPAEGVCLPPPRLQARQFPRTRISSINEEHEWGRTEDRVAEGVWSADGRKANGRTEDITLPDGHSRPYAQQTSSPTTRARRRERGKSIQGPVPRGGVTGVEAPAEVRRTVNAPPASSEDPKDGDARPRR